MQTKIYAEHEILAIVDENDNVITSDTRGNIHRNNLLHRESYVFIFDTKNQLLLSRTKAKDTWDVSCGFHVPFGLTYEEAAVKELHEELGIVVQQSQLIPLLKFHSDNKGNNPTNNRIICVFKLVLDVNESYFKPDNVEVLGIKFFSLHEIQKMITHSKDFEQRFLITFDKL